MYFKEQKCFTFLNLLYLNKLYFYNLKLTPLPMINQSFPVYFIIILICQVLQMQSASAQSVNPSTINTQLSINHNDLNTAFWISDERPLPATDSLFYSVQPAPQFRKEFTTTGRKIKKATLFITAAGYYSATINGEKIGFSSLEPAWTDFNKRIYYAEFDLTKDIRNGNNSLE